MAERNIFCERLTWPQIRDAARADQVVLIPFASIEQHGPHLPVDVDLRLAREVCVRAASRNPHCLVMTPMAFGFEPHHMAWPGTIDIDWRAGEVTLAVRDMAGKAVRSATIALAALAP